MIIIGALIVLFAIFFLLKKHVGTAILASFAGAIVHETISGFYITVYQTTKIPLDIVENTAFIIFVLVIPLFIYISSKRSWSPTPLRIFNSIVASLLVVTLCSGFIGHVIKLDSFSIDVLGIINNCRGAISTLGIVIAYFNVILPHKDYS